VVGPAGAARNDVISRPAARKADAIVEHGGTGGEFENGAFGGKRVRIKVIATGSTQEDRAAGNWGLSLLLGDDLLFDTHGVSAILKRRLREECVDISGIRDIVISHDHWDHTNGLWDLLLQTRTVNVHVCPQAAEALVGNIKVFGGFVRTCSGFQSIRDGVVTTGELPAALNGNTLYEQALVLASAAGLVVVTGCAHPGIVRKEASCPKTPLLCPSEGMFRR